MALHRHYQSGVGPGDCRMTRLGSSMIDLHPGLRVGRWTIVAAAPDVARQSMRLRSRWWCQRECGVEKPVLAQSLQLALRSSVGGSRSCGCLCVERSTRHRNAKGGHSTAEYQPWIVAKNDTAIHATPRIATMERVAFACVQPGTSASNYFYLTWDQSRVPAIALIGSIRMATMSRGIVAGRHRWCRRGTGAM